MEKGMVCWGACCVWAWNCCPVMGMGAMRCVPSVDGERGTIVIGDGSAKLLFIVCVYVYVFIFLDGEMETDETGEEKKEKRKLIWFWFLIEK